MGTRLGCGKLRVGSPEVTDLGQLLSRTSSAPPPLPSPLGFCGWEAGPCELPLASWGWHRKTWLQGADGTLQDGQGTLGIC